MICLPIPEKIKLYSSGVSHRASQTCRIAGLVSYSLCEYTGVRFAHRPSTGGGGDGGEGETGGGGGDGDSTGENGGDGVASFALINCHLDLDLSDLVSFPSRGLNLVQVDFGSESTCNGHLPPAEVLLTDFITYSYPDRYLYLFNFHTEELLPNPTQREVHFVFFVERSCLQAKLLSAAFIETPPDVERTIHIDSDDFLDDIRNLLFPHDE